MVVHIHYVSLLECKKPLGLIRLMRLDARESLRKFSGSDARVKYRTNVVNTHHEDGYELAKEFWILEIRMTQWVTH